MTHLQFAFSLIPVELLDSFVLYGCSAGGLGVLAWVDYVKNMIHSINPKVKYFGLPDSGLFMDYENVQTKDHDYSIRMAVLYNFVNE